jgi:exoribonuclease-2
MKLGHDEGGQLPWATWSWPTGSFCLQGNYRAGAHMTSPRWRRSAPVTTYALFDDAGKFLAGRVMSEAESSVQIELDSGKRVKVKAANVLLRFDKPTPAELIARPGAGGRDRSRPGLGICPEASSASPTWRATTSTPGRRRKAGRGAVAAVRRAALLPPRRQGAFRKAPEETVKAALLGIERKKQMAAQIEAWAGELVAGQCPAPVREQLYRILFKPDKNGPSTRPWSRPPSARSARRWTC